jgi:DNA-directed RNA polymerase subunit alpha
MRIRWRGLELPNRVATDRGSMSDTYGKFVIEPFERGFGVTIGSALRRILLSTLEGSAITQVKIRGVAHEITTLPGVVEDVIDIILNIKSLVVRNTSEEPKVIRIERSEKGTVFASDIITDPEVEIINPDHVIATLTGDVLFHVEMTVENGRGYRPADENVLKDREIGVIPVDSSFSPVVKVKYEIGETRVGQKTNYDKLMLEVWTNGTISPQLAIVEAAKIFRKHLNPFVQYSEPGPEISIDDRPDVGGINLELDRELNMSIADLELSVRATNCLETEGINSVRDLVSRSEAELLEVRNFGETTLKEVKEKLNSIGLELGFKFRGTVSEPVPDLKRQIRKFADTNKRISDSVDRDLHTEILKRFVIAVDEYSKSDGKDSKSNVIGRIWNAAKLILNDRKKKQSLDTEGIEHIEEIIAAIGRLTEKPK